MHLKTLETLELIFARIGPHCLARDLAFYSEGIFPLYRHASYSVRPVLLDLFERYYVPLGARAVPCLPGLVLALLSAMEDVGSDFYHRAVKLLDALAARTPTDAFMAAVWGRLLHNSTVRYTALSYLSMRFPIRGSDHHSQHQPRRLSATPGAPSGAASGRGGSSTRMNISRAAFCPDARRTVIRALIVALQQGDSLVRRTALEMLLHHLSRSKEFFRRGTQVNANLRRPRRIRIEYSGGTVLL